MAILPMTIGGGGGEYKLHTESSFTLAGNGTKTITISDMQRYVFTLGTVRWSNTFGFFHSDTEGDLTCRNGAWEESSATYLHVTVSGNQITIRNGATTAATVSKCDIQYE